MPTRRIRKRSFKLKKEAQEWAKKEKKKAGPSSGIKWETNRTNNTERPWDAVIFKETQ